MSEKHLDDGSQVVRQLFAEGKAFTADLILENEKLRQLNASVRQRLAEAESSLGASDELPLQQRVALVEEENQLLREENQALKNQFHGVEEESREFADRYMEVELQNSNLVNLYVALHQLHMSLEFDDAVTSVKEIFINMVGTETFGIYWVDHADDQLNLIDEIGLNSDYPAVVRLGEGAIGEAAASGSIHVGSAEETDGAGREAIACVPLTAEGQVVAVVAIFRLLDHKPDFQAIDRELFEMVGNHAGVALYSSRVCEYVRTLKQRPTTLPVVAA